jgi:hypothetical protein
VVQVVGVEGTSPEHLVIEYREIKLPKTWTSHLAHPRQVWWLSRFFLPILLTLRI